MKKSSGSQSSSYTSPFTENPGDLKPKRFKIGSFLKRVLNISFLVILSLALLGLVAAFAYVWNTQPDKVVGFFNQIASGLDAFIRSFQSAPVE